MEVLVFLWLVSGATACSSITWRVSPTYDPNPLIWQIGTTTTPTDYPLADGNVRLRGCAGTKEEFKLYVEDGNGSVVASSAFFSVDSTTG